MTQPEPEHTKEICGSCFNEYERYEFDSGNYCQVCKLQNYNKAMKVIKGECDDTERD